MNEYIAKIYTKIIGNIFYWSLCYSFASNTADFKISIFNLTHKVPPSTSFEIRKSLERMPSLAYTEMDQTKNTAFHRCLQSDALFGHCYSYLYVHNLAG